MSFPPYCLALQQMKHEAGLTFAEIADKINKPEVWTSALFFGNHIADKQTADDLLKALGDANVSKTLDLLNENDKSQTITVKTVSDGLTGNGADSFGVAGMAVRGQGAEFPPKDPTLYRLYEVLVVYGWSYKALIREKFGDGIMSAIGFKTTLERKEDKEGNARVVITMDGKFLPYTPPGQW